MQNSKSRPSPFVEAVPVTVWMSVTPRPPQRPKSSVSSCHVGSSAHKSAQGEAAEDSVRQEQRQDHDSTPGLSSSPPAYDSYDEHIHTNPSVNDKDSHPYNNRHQNHHLESPDPQYPDRDHSGDGNSFSYSHHQYKTYINDVQPSRSSISGGGHSSDGSRNSKTQLQSDTLANCDMQNELSNQMYSSPPKKSHSRRDGRQRANGFTEAHRTRRSSAEYESRSFSDICSNKSSADAGCQQTRQRREAHFQREDSRSSSSPPLLQTDSSSHRREELREKRGKDRRQRHSSSSGSDRRDMEGGAGGRKNREYDGRYNAEGRISSDAFKGGCERQSWKDVKRNEDYYTPGEVVKSQVFDRRGREDEVSQRDMQSQGYRRSRHSSSSSSDVGNVGSRERRLQRSGSRDSRGGAYERHMEEVEKYPNHDSYRGEEELERRPLRDSPGRRSARDGSRESAGDRYEQSDRHSCERSSARSKKRDQMDGIPSDRHGRTHDSANSAVNEQRGKDRQTGRQHRSSSRGGSSDHQNYRTDRGNDVDNYRSRYHPDDTEYRSRLEESSRPRHADADCDNDCYSHTSLSSLDTPGREAGRGTAVPEQRPAGHDPSRQIHEEPPHWPEDSTDQAWTQKNKRLPPEGCKSQDDISLEPGADASGQERNVCVLAKACGKLRIQLNHFQYLFLLRLAESFSAFQSDLSADLLTMSSVRSTSKKPLLKRPPKPHPSPTILIPLVLKELEFAVVCPYQMHQRTFSDDFSVVSPFLQGMTTGQDAVFGDEGDGTCFPQLVDSIKGQILT